MAAIISFFTLIGDLSYFGLRAIAAAMVPPFEWQYGLRQVEEIGWKSLPLIVAAGLALGVVMTLHTRSTLVTFGAEAMIPTLQSLSFFDELGPLVTGLLISGRSGCGYWRRARQHAPRPSRSTPSSRSRSTPSSSWSSRG